MSLHKKNNKSGKTCTVTFCLPKEIANGAMDIKVLGDFNDWDVSKAISMRSKNGEYRASVDLERDKEYQFRYLIDNKIWENDSAADKYVPTPFGVENSVVVAST
ncbi:MAG: isoamylase early set domain-containing protein [Saprospiraceae bacterium]|nr:isoamylase early set domain-containing protein [Saprospiraceae bacterium]